MSRPRYLSRINVFFALSCQPCLPLFVTQVKYEIMLGLHFKCLIKPQQYQLVDIHCFNDDFLCSSKSIYKIPNENCKKIMTSKLDISAPFLVL